MAQTLNNSVGLLSLCTFMLIQAYRKSVTRDGGTGRSGTIEDPKNRKSVTRKSVTQKTGKWQIKGDEKYKK